MPENKKLIIIEERELNAKTNTALYRKLAPTVSQLTKQITGVTIPNIRKITLKVTSKEKLLQLINNDEPMEFEVSFVPILQPKQ